MNDETWSVAGALAVLGAVGAALKWMWSAWFGRLDRREQLIEAAEARLRTETDAAMREMRAEIAAMKLQLDELRDVANRQWAVIHMLVAKVDPSDPVLRAAELVLGKRIFTVGPVPETLTTLARQLDEGDTP